MWDWIANAWNAVVGGTWNGVVGGVWNGVVEGVQTAIGANSCGPDQYWDNNQKKCISKSTIVQSTIGESNSNNTFLGLSTTTWLLIGGAILVVIVLLVVMRK